jgi:hypothetical protein
MMEQRLLGRAIRGALLVCLMLPLLQEQAPAAGWRGGITFRDGVAGTLEGHAVADMNYWISNGDWDLADVCYRFEHGAIGTPSAVFVHAWALLRLAVQRQRGFERARAEFERVETEDARLRSHLQALVKAVTRAAPCGVCGGQGRTRCVRCHGASCAACSGGSVACGRCDGTRKAPPSMDDICRVDLCATCEGRGLQAGKLRIPCASCIGVGWRLTPKVE